MSIITPASAPCRQPHHATSQEITTPAWLSGNVRCIFELPHQSMLHQYMNYHTSQCSTKTQTIALVNAPPIYELSYQSRLHKYMNYQTSDRYTKYYTRKCSTNARTTTPDYVPPILELSHQLIFTNTRTTTLVNAPQQMLLTTKQRE